MISKNYKKFNDNRWFIETNEGTTFLWKELLQHKMCGRLIADLHKFPVAEMQRNMKYFSEILERSVRSQGIAWVCSQLKSLERAVLLNSNHYCAISGIGKFLRLSTNRQVLLVMLSIHRNMYTTPKLKLSTIQRKSKSTTKDRISSMETEVRKALRPKFFHIEEFGRIFYKKDTRLKTYMCRENDNPYCCDPTIDTNGRTGGDYCPIQVSFTKRANGSCFDSHTQDFHCLVNYYPQLFLPLKRVWKEWNYKLRKESFIPVKDPSKVLSRVIPIRDKSCKTRVIAIFDSLSQIALRPVHKMLEDVLRNIPTDFTFNHLEGVNYLKSISRGRMCHSVDISSATDTIPVKLSEMILGVLLNPRVVKFPEQFCKDVFAILTDRAFHLENGKKVRYSVGQPMGAYASFPLLALTNHVLVQIAAARAKVPVLKDGLFRLYAVVGDDVVICCPKTAEQYYILLEELDIPISKHKCLSMVNSFEFCHRVVCDGVLQSVPSWNSYYKALVARDPTPVMNACSNYGVPLSYATLCMFFKRSYVRTACAFRSYSFQDLKGRSLAVELLPASVIGHAVRCLEIRDTLNKSTSKPLETDDKFLLRLNYCINIQEIFKAYSKSKTKSVEIPCEPYFVLNKKALKKDGIDVNSVDINQIDDKYKTLKKVKTVYRTTPPKPVWEIAHRVVANTFYLNYINNYNDRKRLYRHLFSTHRGDAGASVKLRSYCMSQRNKWIDDRIIGFVCQDKVVQTKADFPSGK